MLSPTGVFEEICDRKFSCRCPLQLLLLSEYTHKQHSVAFHNNCIYNIFIGCLISIETFQLNKGILQMQANNLYEGSFKKYVTVEGWGVCAIFVTNCYEKCKGWGGVRLL